MTTIESRPFITEDPEETIPQMSPHEFADQLIGPRPSETETLTEGIEPMDPSKILRGGMRIVAIITSLKHGMQVLGIPDTNGNISGDMTRKSVYTQANREAGNTTEPLWVSEDFMRERRGVMLEYLGVDAESRAELATIIDKFQLTGGAQPFDALEHILIGDLEYVPQTQDGLDKNGNPVSGHPAHVATGGMHFEPTSSMILKDRKLIRDQMKDVTKKVADKGVKKYSVSLDGYDKAVSTVFPDTIKPSGSEEARPASVTDVLHWIQEADADKTATLKPITTASGGIKGYIKVSRQGRDKPDGLAVVVVYNKDMTIRTAYPMNR